MARQQGKFSTWLDWFEKTAVTIFLGLMTVVVFLQVFFRFVIKGSLPWSEELARYLMVWAVFIGASMGAKSGAHIGVEAVVGFFPRKAKRVVILISSFLSILFCGLIFYLSSKVVIAILNMGQVSPAMQIPMYWAYLAVPVGAFLMAIRFLQAAFIKWNEEGEQVK